MDKPWSTGQHPGKTGAKPIKSQHSGRPIEATDLELKESHRALIRSFVETVLFGGQLDRLSDFINEDTYAEHNPRLGDDMSILRSALEAKDGNQRRIDYQRVHRVLAVGNFVLCVSEDHSNGVHSAFYDLFRIADDRVVEHWDTTEKVASRGE